MVRLAALGSREIPLQLNSGVSRLTRVFVAAGAPH
jgi:hypothetical protein